MEEIAKAAEKMGLDSCLNMQTLIKMITTKGGCTEVGVKYLEEIDLKDKMINLIEKTEKKASESG